MPRVWPTRVSTCLDTSKTSLSHSQPGSIHISRCKGYLSSLKASCPSPALPGVSPLGFRCIPVSIWVPASFVSGLGPIPADSPQPAGLRTFPFLLGLSFSLTPDSGSNPPPSTVSALEVCGLPGGIGSSPGQVAPGPWIGLSCRSSPSPLVPPETAIQVSPVRSAASSRPPAALLPPFAHNRKDPRQA